MRRSLSRRVMEGVMYRPLEAACLPVLAQDIDPKHFHEVWHPGLYQPVDRQTTFSQCQKLYNRRIIVAAPVEFRKKCLLTPMLVDTGAPQTYLHPISIEKFLGSSCNIPEKLDIFVGKTNIMAAVNHSTDDKHVLAFLNILGMDFLESAVPDLLPFLDKALKVFQPPHEPIEVLVTDGKVTFGVKPEHPVVWALKKAIKEEIAPKYPKLIAPDITIKTRRGKVMGDEGVLKEGTKYLFKLPK